jgi:pyruvate dehydrogenase E1 component alpha subunit
MLNIQFRNKIMKASRSFSTITVPIYQPDFHNMEDVIPKETTTTPEELMRFYRELGVMRRTEIVSDLLYKKKEIRGFCHLYDGQEAVAVGMNEALTYDDAIIGAYRIHCIAMSRGMTPHDILSEMMQKGTGPSKGKGGSMHYYKTNTNFYGGNGIVGAQVPVGAGIAFALKYKKQPNICVTLYGDGAAN